MKQYLLHFFLLVLSAVVVAGCRGDIPFIHTEEEELVPGGTGGEVIKGFFLLNEGNMGSNKATIDFFNCETGKYLRNIYPSRNPDIVKELGDVGNDIAIYDNKLYAVINCSHYVEVMDARTAMHIGSIDILNCRYITFHGSKAYVSSYAGPVQLDPNARPGKVVEIDTETLQITREVVVGYQPEEMVVTDGKLYVANSGGYRYPNYDTTISVIDLESFEVVNTIDVAINLHRMELDRYGRIYVSSRGDYYDIGADVYVVDTRTDEVIGNLGIPASEMCLSGDSLYMTAVEWSYILYVNHQPVSVLPENQVMFRTQNDKKTVIETTLDMSDFDGEGIIYAMFYVRNWRDWPSLNFTASPVFSSTHYLTDAENLQAMKEKYN